MSPDAPTRMPSDDELVAAVACEILRYLAQRPDAGDTADNIRRWWLAQLRVEEAATRVQRALNQLVSDGAVIRRVLPGGGVIYSASAKQRAKDRFGKRDG